MCRLHKDGRGSRRDQQTRTTPTKPPSEGEVEVVADLMCRTSAERTQDVEVRNESHCMGKFVLEIRLSHSGYPAYLIKFVDRLGRTCIFGDLNAPNQIATNAIVRSGARWLIEDCTRAIKDLGEPRRVYTNEDGSKTFIWDKITAHYYHL